MNLRGFSVPRFFPRCIENVNQFNWTATHPECWYSMKFKKCYYHWDFVVNDALLSALQPSSTNLQEKLWLQKYPQHTWNSGNKRLTLYIQRGKNPFFYCGPFGCSVKLDVCGWSSNDACKKLCAVRLFSHSESFFVNLMWKQIF